MSNSTAYELYDPFSKSTSPFENNPISFFSLKAPSTEAALDRGKKTHTAFASNLKSVTKPFHISS